MIFLFIKIYIYLTYRCILIFENCRITVSPYPYRCIGQPYRCNLASNSNDHQNAQAPLLDHLITALLVKCDFHLNFLNTHICVVKSLQCMHKYPYV
jgi:hypothetical protein